MQIKNCLKWAFPEQLRPNLHWIARAGEILAERLHINCCWFQNREREIECQSQAIFHCQKFWWRPENCLLVRAWIVLPACQPEFLLGIAFSRMSCPINGGWQEDEEENPDCQVWRKINWNWVGKPDWVYYEPCFMRWLWEQSIDSWKLAAPPLLYFICNTSLDCIACKLKSQCIAVYTIHAAGIAQTTAVQTYLSCSFIVIHFIDVYFTSHLSTVQSMQWVSDVEMYLKVEV